MSNKQQGITLIETIVALLVITTGVLALVGVIVYTLTAYDQSRNRLAAISLAREGTEVIRMVRDSNWLTQEVPAPCPDLGADQFCYPNWLGNSHNDLARCRGSGCFLVLNRAAGNYTWRISSISGNNSNQYRLVREDSTGLYVQGSGSGTAPFYRKILITENFQAPYSESHPLLTVRSTVAWTGRNCAVPQGNNPDNATNNCKVTVESRLTNWKNY